MNSRLWSTKSAVTVFFMSFMHIRWKYHQIDTTCSITWIYFLIFFIISLKFFFSPAYCMDSTPPTMRFPFSPSLPLYSLSLSLTLLLAWPAASLSLTHTLSPLLSSFFPTANFHFEEKKKLVKKSSLSFFFHLLNSVTMAISKNLPLLKNHFRKHWQERVKFNPPTPS